MSKIDEGDGVEAVTRVMQIIVASLTLGVAFFSAIVLGLLRDDKPLAPNTPGILGLPMLTALAVFFGLTSVIASFVIPKLMTDAALKQIAKGPPLDETKYLDSGERQIYPAGDAGRLLPIFQTQLIVASALNEGAAFFAVLAYMIEGHPIALGVAAVLIALLVSRFPTVDRVRGWLAAQLERLALIRRDEF